MGVAVTQIDLTEREKGTPFVEVWGFEPPKTFDETHEFSRMIVNRMAWIMSEEERLRELVRRHTNALNIGTHGTESRLAQNHLVEAEAALAKTRTMREQGECDIATMFPARNPYRTRDMVMLEVDRVLAQRTRRGA